MKKIAGSLLTLALALGTATVFGGDKDPVDNSPQYNLKTEVTIKGTIQAVREVPATEVFAGVHVSLLILKTNETVDVFIAPQEFLKFMGVPLRAGMKDVTLVGSKVKSEGKDLMLARELKVDTTVLSIRDDKGFPNWLWLMKQGITSGL